MWNMPQNHPTRRWRRCSVYIDSSSSLVEASSRDFNSPTILTLHLLVAENLHRKEMEIRLLRWEATSMLET